MISIKDACLLLGISPTTIRLYEKNLPLTPWVIGENGYRGFYFEHILNLFSGRTMIKYGLPVKEAFDISVAKDFALKETALDKQRIELVSQREYLDLLIESLDAEKELLSKIPYLLHDYEIIDMPAFCYLSFKNAFFSEETERLLTNWLKVVPLVKFTPHYRINALTNGHCRLEEVACGSFSIASRYAHLVDTNSSEVKAVPQKKCLATVITMKGISKPPMSDKLEGALPFDKEQFEKTRKIMGDYLAKENLSLTEDVYTQLLYSEFSGKFHAENPDVATHYFYAWTPIE